MDCAVRGRQNAGHFVAQRASDWLGHWSLGNLDAFIEILVVAAGVLLTSTGDFLDALRDLRHPLWGEARILRTLQFMRASCANIHFTAFGLSYLRDHFDSNPTDILQAF